MEARRLLQCLFVILTFWSPSGGEIPKPTNASKVKVNKCCERDEIYQGRSCTLVKDPKEWWKPLFVSETGDGNLQINHTLVIGLPDCGHMQLWPIYHYQGSSDRLRLLPNGVLRHFFDHIDIPGEFNEQEFMDDPSKKILYHDYEPGKYCLDRKIYDDRKSEFAYVCPPEVHKYWLTSTEFLMHNVISPTTHSITIICLLVIAIIYFVMPTLRDLTGNIVTTICVCLIVSQVADMIRLLTVFKSHISLLIAETICYFGMLAAFFWLNSLGYYIWKTFRSRNVFLRITDGKKYCYYGGYAWTCTLILGALAVFSHFTMDYADVNTDQANLTYDQRREQIGSLGMIIFFVPVAFTVIIDIFFFATTLKTINKMHTYGRIHHKLRHSFRMFFLLLLTMTMIWLFFLSSFSKYEGLVNAYITMNALLGPLILYTCIFNQKHVSYLLRKTCCYNSKLCVCCKAEQENEWGDEMTAMNSMEYH